MPFESAVGMERVRKRLGSFSDLVVVSLRKLSDSSLLKVASYFEPPLLRCGCFAALPLLLCH